MPTNLTPEAIEAERRYRAAQSMPERIAALEVYLAAIPKHKGTEHMRADLRRQLARLRRDEQSHKTGGRQASAFHIPREGAGQVAAVGATNVGKSSLVAALTNATPDVGAYPFTTWTPTPGMMPVENIQIQLVDTPPLTREHVEPELYELIRHVDLVLLLVDLQGYPLQQLEESVALLEERHILPLHRQTEEEDLSVTALPFLVLANKNDDAATDGDFEVLCELLDEAWAVLPFSATTGRHVDTLKRVVFEQLHIIRVYARPPGKKPDFDAPFVLREGGTVEEFAAQIHRDFYDQLRSARIWGTGVYDGQSVGRDHVLHDGDVVELRM